MEMSVHQDKGRGRRSDGDTTWREAESFILFKEQQHTEKSKSNRGDHARKTERSNGNRKGTQGKRWGKSLLTSREAEELDERAPDPGSSCERSSMFSSVR